MRYSPYSSLIGLGLLAVGMVLLLWGLGVSDLLPSQVSAGQRHVAPGRPLVLMVLGVIICGLAMARWLRRRV